MGGHVFSVCRVVNAVVRGAVPVFEAGSAVWQECFRHCASERVPGVVLWTVSTQQRSAVCFITACLTARQAPI